MEVKFDIKVICTCGKELYSPLVGTKWEGIVTVIPCPDCIKEVSCKHE